MRLSIPPLRITPLFAWRVSASVTWIALDEVARLTGEAGREVDVARDLDMARKEDGRAMNGLDRSPTEGFERIRLGGLDGEVRETAFRPETSDVVRGVCVFDRPRRWVGVLGLNAIEAGDGVSDSIN